MVVPFILLLVSLGVVGLGMIWPDHQILWLVAAPAALASLILLLRAGVQTLGPEPDAQKFDWRLKPVARAARPLVVVDGSNVLYWKDRTPQIETVREVLAMLSARGGEAAVVFDANAGYLVSGRYLHDGALGRMVGLPQDRVLVVHKGSVADEAVLATARDQRARIVTNDRYRDWEAQHPEVRTPGHLIRGGYHDGVLWLALESPGVMAEGVATGSQGRP